MGKSIDELLLDVKIDRVRVKTSIDHLLDIYNLRLQDVSISRKELAPSEIFVASVEECDLKEAKRIMGQKYQASLPAPITVLQYRGKNVLFMGSNRSVIFVLKDKSPDCIVVKVPDWLKEPVLVSEAKQTLKEVIEKHPLK